MERLAARHERVEPGTGAEQFTEPGSRLDHLLEVVEQNQHPSVADVLGKRAVPPEGVRGGAKNELRIAECRQGNPPDAVWIGVGGEPAACSAKRVLPVPPGP
jgi:hypothetical protein